MYPLIYSAIFLFICLCTFTVFLVVWFLLDEIRSCMIFSVSRGSRFDIQTQAVFCRSVFILFYFIYYFLFFFFLPYWESIYYIILSNIKQNIGFIVKFTINYKLVINCSCFLVSYVEFFVMSVKTFLAAGYLSFSH